jgi:hypothetical protein
MIPALRGLHLRTGAKGLIDREEARKNMAGCWFDDSHFPSAWFFLPSSCHRGVSLVLSCQKGGGMVVIWFGGGSRIMAATPLAGLLHCMEQIGTDKTS